MGSKLDNYIAAKHRAALVRATLMRATGRNGDGSDDTQNDKHRLQIVGDLKIEAGYGYYGSSSYYGGNLEGPTLSYVARAINAFLPTVIADRAIKYAEDEAETARKAAEDEAREVLRGASQ